MNTIKKQLSSQVIFILGPTGSGKTALAEKLALDLDAELINADMGQFYASLSVGTAKPNYRETPFKQHLFDICRDPVDFDVKKYRSLVLKTVDDIHMRGKRAIIVGGSLFYIKSLFYPPLEFEGIQFEKNLLQFDGTSNEELWQKLNLIDPIRAEAIHVNDRYRLERSLTLFNQTGRIPSECSPSLQKPFDSFFVWIDIEKSKLKDRIAQRTKIMLDGGWIEEVGEHNTDQWYDFYDRKGLIGYKAIADWIRSGKDRSDFDELNAFLVRATCLYAKRQKTFWKSFSLSLSKDLEIGRSTQNNYFVFENQEGFLEYRKLLSSLL